MSVHQSLKNYFKGEMRCLYTKTKKTENGSVNSITKIGRAIICKKKEGFATQREAKEFEIEFQRKSKTDCSMLFENLVHHYLEDCQNRLKPTTLDNKTYVIKLKILPFFEHMSLNDINPATIRKWQNKLIAYKDENGKPYSPTYLKTMNNQLSAIFNYARKYYKLSENPVVICGSIGKSHADTMQFWTLEEFKQFILAVENKAISKTMFELLFWTGMRSGELLALSLNDFDFEAKTVSINKTFIRLNGQDIIQSPKTPKSNRIVTLPDFICTLIKNYALNFVSDANSRMFPVTKSFLSHEMIRGSKKSGVKRIRVHDIRHSHASLLIEQGFSPLLISERLGHENVQTTLQTYSHLYPNKHNEVAAKLQKLNY